MDGIYTTTNYFIIYLVIIINIKYTSKNATFIHLLSRIYDLSSGQHL